MKTRIITLLLVLPAAGALFAGPPERRPGPPAPEELLERFDEDGSGALELAEIEAMLAAGRERMERFREQRQERVEDRRERFDENRGPRPDSGTGQGRRLDGSGQQRGASDGNAPRSDRRGIDVDVLVEKFDTDGDGYLKADEVEEMLEILRERRSGPPRRD